MAFDYTNLLETAAQANNGDFVFTNRAGTVDVSVGTTQAAGEWSEDAAADNGDTPSGQTGPNGVGFPATPTRAGFIYTEMSTPSASTTWAIRRAISFDSTTQNVFLDLRYHINIFVTSTIYVEYATVASPNETTDWSVLTSFPGAGQNQTTLPWDSDTFDFSGIESTTLWIRIRFDTVSEYQNDFCISTWREYSVDSAATEQEGFRFRNDDDSEADATWKEDQDDPASVGKEENIRLRMLVDTDGDAATRQITFQYKRDDEAASEWRDV